MLSDSSGIQRLISSAELDALEVPEAESMDLSQSWTSSSMACISSANLHRKRCQKQITTEVQMGSDSQQPWMSSR